MLNKKTLINHIKITKPKVGELSIGSSYLFRDTFSLDIRKINSEPFKIAIYFKVNSGKLKKSDYQKIIRSELDNLFQNITYKNSTSTSKIMKEVINDKLKIGNLEIETVYVNDFFLFDHFMND